MRGTLETTGKHVVTLGWSILRNEAADWNCDECNTSCQSACKTSCTVASQSCPKGQQERSSKETFYRGRRTKMALA
ncbi:MAG: six-cysteine ranthipeptide SCIFF [Limnochordales bacterium]|nr:six-cysteine ranthipeptide SCIFF [Limnochordales bacterium]